MNEALRRVAQERLRRQLEALEAYPQEDVAGFLECRLARCIEVGAAVCDMVVAESLVRAVSPDDLAARRRFFAAVEVLAVDTAAWQGVDQLAEGLARSGAVVAAGDVVIASCAMAHELIVVHYDSDYDILGQACGVHEWVVPQGTL